MGSLRLPHPFQVEKKCFSKSVTSAARGGANTSERQCMPIFWIAIMPNLNYPEFRGNLCPTLAFPGKITKCCSCEALLSLSLLHTGSRSDFRSRCRPRSCSHSYSVKSSRMTCTTVNKTMQYSQNPGLKYCPPRDVFNGVEVTAGDS